MTDTEIIRKNYETRRKRLLSKISQEYYSDRMDLKKGLLLVEMYESEDVIPFRTGNIVVLSSADLALGKSVKSLCEVTEDDIYFCLSDKKWHMPPGFKTPTHWTFVKTLPPEAYPDLLEEKQGILKRLIKFFKPR